jgi:hypothetical protein
MGWREIVTGAACALWVIGVSTCVTACTPNSSGPVSCDSAAEHLRKVCGDYPGESFRAICELKDVPLVGPFERRCVANLKKCTEETLDACDVHDIIIACSSDSDCPAPDQCDVEEGECVRCKSDQDCADGRGCLMSLCYDKDSKLYMTLIGLEQRDAGTTDAGTTD